MTTIIITGIIIASSTTTSSTSFSIAIWAAGIAGGPAAAGDLTPIKNRLRSPQNCLPYSP
ncbi:hypothetical protein Q3C01_08710 [Bradyrhizobium sp. UFLA05-109]